MYAKKQNFIHFGGTLDNTFEDFKRELIQKNDLVSVVSKYVQLERKGRYYWCRCPFHGEKTPSLCINDIDNFFYCFGCHVGGNVINFVMQIETLSFMEAVKLLAEWANMELPETYENNSADIAKAKKRRDRLYALMKETALHYHDNLNKPTASNALLYMKKRQISDSQGKHFGIGYADGYNDLIEFLKSKGYSEEEMLSAGVAKKRDNRIYDPLANRLIFPIIDILGNVIAFGGRSLEAKPDFAKYLNTAETEIFNKRNTLYAINYLKKQRQQGPIPYVIVVEGYMDTISLHKAGFTMTVASMGTALTQSQAKLIKRFADKVYICYDGDSAGQNATLRGLDILRENGLDVMVVQLPDKYDPDDVIKTYGREGYQKILDESLPLIEFKLKYLKTKFDLTSVDGRVKYLNEALVVLSEIPSSVERELYTPMVSEISETNIDFIRRELDKKLSGKQIESEIKSNFEKPNITETKVAAPLSDEGVNSSVVLAENSVLCALAHGKPYAHFKNNAVHLFTGKRQQIYELIESLKKEKSGSILQELFERFSDDDKSQVLEIINASVKTGETEENEKQYYFDCVWKIYKHYLENKKLELSKKFASEVDNVKRSDLLKEIIELTQKIKNKKVDEL